MGRAEGLEGRREQQRKIKRCAVLRHAENVTICELHNPQCLVGATWILGAPDLEAVACGALPLLGIESDAALLTNC
jgi:hypothetical protein